MRKLDATYTEAMDRLVLTTAGIIIAENGSYGSRWAVTELGLLRKLVQSCLELAGDEASGETDSGYTWEEKIESLNRIAKEVGVYLDVEVQEPGTDYCKAIRRRLMDAYDEFCEWRHDEPYVVDEIKASLTGKDTPSE